MDSSTAQEIEMGSQTLESMLVCRNVNTQPQPQQEKKPKAVSAAEMQHALKCPRCDSTNTKFCYYNNYSLSQPRYFCKSCRRYWTKGGTLRNVPVGGGCRKNKRSSCSSSSSSSSKRTPEQPLPSTPIPSFSYDSSDLTLAIARLQKQQSNQFGAEDFSIWANPNMPQHHGGIFGNHNNSGLFGFSETPATAAQNLYYGMGNLELENGGGMGIPFQDFGAGGGTTVSTAVTTVKQEMCGGRGREGDGRVLWGFPWQNVGGGGGGGGSAVPELDSGRGNWNGIGVTNWQGLLNSPLM